MAEKLCHLLLMKRTHGFLPLLLLFASSGAEGCLATDPNGFEACTGTVSGLDIWESGDAASGAYAYVQLGTLKCSDTLKDDPRLFLLADSNKDRATFSTKVAETQPGKTVTIVFKPTTDGSYPHVVRLTWPEESCHGTTKRSGASRDIGSKETILKH